MKATDKDNRPAGDNGKPQLLPEHLADLRRSGLSDETIARCRFYSVNDDRSAERILQAKPPPGLVPALAIPFAGPGGYLNGYARLKPDNPRLDEHGKPVKYESPRGVSNRAYFPPDTLPVLADPGVPLVVTEGEKKAAAADQAGFACIGLVGVWGWQKKRPIAPDGTKAPERELIDDLVAVAWEGRPVVIAYDSDLAEKYDVQLAAWELASVLRERGADVRLARLPAGPEGAKVGLDDFLLKNGDEALRSVLANALPAEEPSAQWAAPVSLVEELNVPEFPRSILSPWHERWVDATAEATQTPRDLAAFLSLAVYGAGLARKVRVKVRDGWTEPVNLFTAVALPPGERKSAVFAEALQPVEEYESSERARMAPVIARAASEHRMIEARMKAAESKAAKTTDPDEREQAKREAKELAEELERHKVPAEPVLIIDDDTPESVAKTLAEQGGRLLQAAPEGTPIEIAKGRYTEKPNFDVYLKSHSGDTLRTGRVVRKREDIARPALSAALAVQPSVIEGLAEVATLATRGFLARWLYAIPASLVGERKVAAEPVRAEVTAAYRAKVRAAWALPTPVAHVPEHVLEFAGAADLELQEFEQWLEPLLGPGGELVHLAGWGNKLAGAVARIAGILHLADANAPDEALAQTIPISVVRRAVRLAKEYLLPHARAAFGAMGADPRFGAARKVLAHLVRHPEVTEFTRTDIWRPLRGSFPNPDELDTPLALLVTLNYLRLRTPDRPKGTPGPKPIRYRVNPLWDRTTPGTNCTRCTSSTPNQASSASSASSARRCEPGEEG
jgi:hypothetical protein